jgi:sulfur relay (sulfurtransferase) complex TusBCD TusD component (DsrE family)
MDSKTEQGSQLVPETNIKELLALLQSQDCQVELCVRPKTSKGSQQPYRTVMGGSQLVQWYLANIAY